MKRPAAGTIIKNENRSEANRNAAVNCIQLYWRRAKRSRARKNTAQYPRLAKG